jgi:hypothetical protein
VADRGADKARTAAAALHVVAAQAFRDGTPTLPQAALITNARNLRGRLV